MRRILITSLIAGVVALAAPSHTLAQEEGTLTSSSQRATFQYGDSLTFSIQAEAAETLTSAWVIVAVGGSVALTSEEARVTPGTRIEATLRLTVESLRLPPFATLTYRWELADAAGRRYRTIEQAIVYEDNSVPWAWRTVSAGGVTVHTSGQDERVGQAALEIASSTLSQARRALGVSQPEEVNVYVYPELAPLAASLQLHGQRVEDWVAAYADPDQRVVLVAARPGPEMLPSLQRDLPHVLTHLVVAAAAGDQAENVPGWLDEGLALMSTGRADPTLTDTLEAAVRDDRLLPLTELCAPGFGRFPPQDATLAYAQSDSLVRYVMARYGVSQVRALLAASGGGLSCEHSVREGLGISLAQLETQWHNDLLRQAARTPSEGGTLMPWIAVWAVSLGLAVLFIAPQPHHQGAEAPRRVRSGQTDGQEMK